MHSPSNDKRTVGLLASLDLAQRLHLKAIVHSSSAVFDICSSVHFRRPRLGARVPLKADP